MIFTFIHMGVFHMIDVWTAFYIVSIYLSIFIICLAIFSTSKRFARFTTKSHFVSKPFSFTLSSSLAKWILDLKISFLRRVWCRSSVEAARSWLWPGLWFREISWRRLRSSPATGHVVRGLRSTTSRLISVHKRRLV